MSEPSIHPSLPLYAPDCRVYSDALADVLCWFNGFAAAKPDAPMPPSLDTLRELNIKLKEHC